MSWSTRILIALASMGFAFAAGWGAAVRHQIAEATRDALAQSEANRETERLRNTSAARSTDALIQDSKATERRAADAAGRLRALTAELDAARSASSPSRNDEATPAAGLLPDATAGALTDFAREAEELADRLRDCQRRLDL